MMGKQHVVLGAAVGVSSAALLPLSLPEVGAWVAIVTICSLWPDLDGQGALLSQRLPPLSWVTRGLAKTLYRLTATSKDASEPRVHRGASHAPTYILTCSIALYFVLAPFTAWALVIAGAFCVGNLAHLLGDAFSLSGLPLLWPLRVKGKAWYDVRAPKPMRFRVGGPIELTLLRPLCYALLIASIGLFIYTRGIDATWLESSLRMLTTLHTT